MNKNNKTKIGEKLTISFLQAEWDNMLSENLKIKSSYLHEAPYVILSAEKYSGRSLPGLYFDIFSGETGIDLLFLAIFRRCFIQLEI